MNILLLGNGRHGKDTVANYISEKYKLSVCSSSEAANELYVFDKLKDKYNYKSLTECFNDRFDKRDDWFKLIEEYNKEDGARLAKGIFKKHEVYIGMRSNYEFQSCLKENLFDIIIWIDASDRLPSEPKTSFNISKNDADVIITNNTTLEDLYKKVDNLFKFIL